MDDILFPWWATRAPPMAMASAMRLHLRAPEFRDSGHASLGKSGRTDPSVPQMGGTNFPWYPNTTSGESGENPFHWLGGPKTCWSNLGSTPSGPTDGTHLNPSLDLINSPHILLLLRLAYRSSAGSGAPNGMMRLTVGQCTATLALMAIAVECKALRDEVIKNFLTECSRLFTSLVPRLPSMQFPESVDVEEFCASLVACGLSLRGEIDDLGQDGSGGLVRESSSGMFSPRVPSPTTAPRSGAAYGFGVRAVDRVILSCIPSTVKDCVESAVARGALRGLCFTRSRRPVYWGPEMIQRIQGLANTFASTSHQDPPHKRVLLLLLEAMSCARNISMEHTSKWISAVLQESYIVNGLMQKDLLHARVVAASLNLLMLQYQNVTSQFVANARANLAPPDFGDGDRLIESVWHALQTAKDRSVPRGTRTPTLYGANLQMVVFHLLFVELERLRCSLSVGRAQQAADGVNSPVLSARLSQQGSNTFPDYSEKKDSVAGSSTAGLEGRLHAQSSVPYYAGANEEALRVGVIGNILRFIMLPSSIFTALPTTGRGSSMWEGICTMLARVLSIYTSPTEVSSSANYANATDSVCFDLQGQCRVEFSNQYYRNLEGMCHLLIDRMIREWGEGDAVRVNEAAAAAFFLECNITVHDNGAVSPEERGNSAAQKCLIGLCSTDAHLRSFVTSVLLDFVSKVCTLVTLFTYHPEDAIPVKSVMTVFDAVNQLLVPKSVEKTISKKVIISSCGTVENVRRCAEVFLSSYVQSFGDKLNQPGCKLKKLLQTGEIPNAAMRAFGSSLWELIERLVNRMAAILQYDSLSVDSWNEICRETIAIGRILSTEVMKCILAVAWPKSGVLYQNIKSTGPVSPKELRAAGSQSISPLLLPLAVLLHFIPPRDDVISREEMRFRTTKCLRMVVKDSDEFQRYMCHFTGKADLPTTTECCTSLFRSVWFLFSFYDMAGDAVAFTRPRLIKEKVQIDLNSGLTLSQVRLIAACASASRPLMRMNSESIREVVSDIEVLLSQLVDVQEGTSLSEKKIKKVLGSFILRLCPKSGKALSKLSAAELFLMKSLFQLELVRCGFGFLSSVTTYHHYDIKDFVASPAIPRVLQFVTEYICIQYQSALKCFSIPDYAFKVLGLNVRQLLLYAAFGVRSVRECAVYFLRSLLTAFPMQTVQSGGLPLLWRLIDIVDVANPREIKVFCEKMRYLGDPALPTEYKSTERLEELMMLRDLAQEWAEVGRRRAPQDLLHIATQFVTSGYAEGVSVESVHLGTKLGILAGQIPDVPTRKKGQEEEKGTSNVVIKFSRARGSILSALSYVSQDVIEEGIIVRLSVLVQEGRRMLLRQAEDENRQTVSSSSDARVTTNDVPESYLAKLENELYSVTVTLGAQGPIRLKTRRMLVLYLVQAPLKLFSTKAVKIASECWSWLIISHRETMVIPILKSLVEVLQWTIAEKMGLFDGDQTRQNETVETGVNCDAQVPARSVETPHHALFKFLVDNYLRHDSAMMQNTAVLSLLFIIASSIVQSPLALSLKDSSFLETMGAMVLVGKVIHQVFLSNIRHLRGNRPLIIPFTSLGCLRQRWYRALLHWFRKMPPSWYFANDPGMIPTAIATLQSLLLLLRTEKKSLRQNSIGFLDFSTDLQAPGRMIGVLPSVRRRDILMNDGELSDEGIAQVSGVEQRRMSQLLELLLLLVDHELLRLRVWQQPRRTLQLKNTMEMYAERSLACLDAAVAHDPMVAVAMVKRLSGSFHRLSDRLCQHVVARPERFTNIPEAADYYLTESVIRRGAPKLYLFASAGIIQSLRLLDERYSSSESVASYAIRSLLSKNSEHLIFYLPQLLQVLGSDRSGRIHGFLEKMARGSTMFCHQLLWALRTEGEGKHQLAERCRELESAILGRFSPEQMEFYKHEFDFIDTIISVSGELMEFEKIERKPKLRLRLRDEKFHTPGREHHLYLPTNPGFRVTGVIAQTASAMQSAAKCPIFVQFTCVERDHEDTRPPSSLPAMRSSPLRKACIFKMGDDCRQDQIALQLIELFRRIFKTINVPSFLYPYRVVTTGQTSGIIECVPNSLSRNEIGKLVESNLAEYFVQVFGHPETMRFREARENFVKSAAAYSVVTFVLNIKDRHNGNIMVDANGNLVHIDFGFLFDTSPGGDMNFESSPFKLTTEMIQLIGRDVGSKSTLKSSSLQKALIDEENYTSFKVLTNRCYLAVRQYAREICILVELMLRSGLPCFKPQQTIANLAKRLSMDHSEITAADYMRKRIHESKQNIRTNLYDHFQRIVEGIEM